MRHQSDVAPTSVDATPDPPATAKDRNPVRLRDIGPPDEKKREVNGVMVIGSALTDAHVNAICKLTDDTKPDDFNEQWLRGIVHTGDNRADHVWQTADYQEYQHLELSDGIWRIVETGGGFGNFSQNSN